MGKRISSVHRITKETDIRLDFCIDGTGNAEVDTGIGFLDHMLDNFARHGLFDLNCRVKGDLHVDGHHTTEDTGIVLGQAIRESVGEKQRIRRYGSAMIPMDETLMLCSLDLSGRPYFVYDLQLSAPRVGGLDTELVKEFFYAVSYSAGMNLHIKMFHGENNHHIIEAAFKAFAKALDQATCIDERINGVLSTKGLI